MIAHILRFKVTAGLKSLFEPSTASLFKSFGLAIVYGGFALGAYSIANGITRYVLEDARIGLFLYHRFISMLLFVFFMMVNLGNIVVSYSTLYKSSEVHFLLTKPVPYGSIFVIKFLDNFLYSSGTLFIVAFATLLGYGAYFNFHWPVLAAVLIGVLVPFMFLSACIAVLVLMAVMKIAGRFGFRKVMIGIGLLYLLFVAIFFENYNPIMLIEKVGGNISGIDQYLPALDPGFLKYLPNNWVADFLFFFVKAEFGVAASYSALILLVTASVFAVTVWVGTRFYYRSWLTSVAFGRPSSERKNFSIIGSRRFTVPLLPNSQSDAILKRDILSFAREPSQWIHLLVLLVLISVFLTSIRNINLSFRVEILPLATYISVYAFSGFLIASISLRFVFPQTSLEGMTYWTLRSSPVDLRKVYLSKWGVSFLMIFPVAAVIAVVTNYPFIRLSEQRPLLLYFGLFSAFWFSVALTSVNLALGTLFADMGEKNPIRIASSQGATLTFLLSLVYLGICIGVVVGPLSNYIGHLYFFTPFDMKDIVVPGTVFGTFSAALAGLVAYIGIRLLRRDF